MGEVTQLIASARAGDRSALDRLFELLYPELRRIAHRRLVRHPRDGAVGTTALVNECFLKFARRDGLAPADGTRFLGYSASVMRSIVIDAARAAASDSPAWSRCATSPAWATPRSARSWARLGEGAADAGAPAAGRGLSRGAGRAITDAGASWRPCCRADNRRARE